MKLKLSLAIVVFVLCTGIANAQVIRHERNQHQRIKQGVRSGELTAAERKKLALQQKDIREDVKEAREDHVVTPAEKKEIRQDQRQASRSIYRKKHNNRER